MATRFPSRTTIPGAAALARQLSGFTVLIVPGRGDSGPAHWQTVLEHSLPGARRVVQDDWENPDLSAWAARIAGHAAAARQPVLAVAHSFGCLATVAALTEHGAAIDAALLVAPANPDRFAIPAARLAQRLSIPSLLVASRNDPWMSHADALAWAERWHSELHDAGFAGHINVASGHGHWPQLPALLRQLTAGPARGVPAPTFSPSLAAIAA